MKINWFSVLNESINMPFDENLAYELDIFLKDFIYLRKEDDKIILRCLKNGKDYELKLIGNSVVIKYDYEKNKSKYFIYGKLDIYNRNNNILVNDEELINSNSVCYKSNIKIKNVSLDSSLVEVIGRKAFYFGNIDHEYKRRLDGIFVKDKTSNYYSNSSTYYDKLITTDDLNIKFSTPDIIVGSECIRNENGTAYRKNKVIQGIMCSSDYILDDDSYPVSLLSDDVALKYFNNELKGIDKSNYVKKRKIGF